MATIDGLGGKEEGVRATETVVEALSDRSSERGWATLLGLRVTNTSIIELPSLSCLN
ncbi:MAG: hypothetical protein LQ351_008115 [Letrouitia transgressa]|nr:MAG: hypothetical protein LQ351_008115 [Letrouitia transgressa]